MRKRERESRLGTAFICENFCPRCGSQTTSFTVIIVWFVRKIANTAPNGRSANDRRLLPADAGARALRTGRTGSHDTAAPAYAPKGKGKGKGGSRPSNERAKETAEEWRCSDCRQYTWTTRKTRCKCQEERPLSTPPKTGRALFWETCPCTSCAQWDWHCSEGRGEDPPSKRKGKKKTETLKMDPPEVQGEPHRGPPLLQRGGSAAPSRCSRWHSGPACRTGVQAQQKHLKSHASMSIMSSRHGQTRDKVQKVKVRAPQGEAAHSLRCLTGFEMSFHAHFRFVTSASQGDVAPTRDVASTPLPFRTASTPERWAAWSSAAHLSAVVQLLCIGSVTHRVYSLTTWQ